MEYWNLYDYEGKKKKKLAIRGTKLNDDDFHLVVNVWIMNDKNEFLITQRSLNKSHPLMWECTGGSALIGETSKEAAIRETKEELGIDVSESEASIIGRTRRYYKNCPDILDVWLFKTNVSLNDITIQEDEVNDVMWASSKEIKQLFLEGKFEANAMFNKVININSKKEIYYVGFNANNAICNEEFLTGSITLNPNNEKELSVIFEVPQNELYCIGFSNNIDCVGKQTFVDKIRNIKCEYETFKEMINVRDSLLKQPSKYKKEPKNKEEEIIPKVVFTEPKESVYESLTKKGTNPDEEIKVDLNDFLGTPDDGTDWNYTELSETDCKALAKQKIYYSENKGAWVKVKPSNDETSALERQKRMEIAEREMKEQSICNISFDLQGRQVKQIPTVANSGSVLGDIILKIEVSPAGEVVKCDIDNRSVKDTEIRQQCVVAALKTKFNTINSKRNQLGMMRFYFKTNK